MISKQEILEISNLVKSRMQSALESLSATAAAIRDSWSTEVEQVTFITNCVSTVDGTVPLSDDEVAFIESLIANGNEIAFNTSSVEVHKMSATDYDAYEADISIDDETVAVYDRTEHILVPSPILTPQAKFKINKVASWVKNISKRCGTEYALAEICSLASSGDWLSNTNLSNALYAKVEQYSLVLGSYASELLTAIAGGPLVLLQLIEALVSKIASVNTSEDLSVLLSSTEIILNNFGAGIIVQTIGTLISAASLVVSCFSRIAGAVVAIAGAITTLVGRIVISATTAFDDTHYTVNAGCEVAHAFAFVVDQDIIVDSHVAQYMREKGWDRMTVICPKQAAVYMMYLEEYDSTTNNTIHYEVHLSSDVDISQNLREVNIDTSGIAALVVDCPNKINLNTWSCSLAFMPGYDIPGEGKTQSSIFVIKNHSSSNETTASYKSSISAGINDANLIFPADFNLFDQLKQWYSGDLNNFLDVRLCSAIILYVGWKLSSMVGRGWLTLNGNQNILLGVRHYTSEYSGTAFKLLENVWDYAWKCFCSTNSFTAQHKLKSSFGLADGTERDGLMTTIKSAFDELNYKNYIPSSLIQQPIRVTDDGVGGVQVTEIGTAGHDLDSGDCNSIIGSKSDLIMATSSNEMLANYAAGVWSKKCCIELPKLTFSGFIAGLIVDGLVIAAMLAITVAVTVGWVKMKNKRAQLQAQTEAKWYAYQDDQSSANWKEYKKTRFKYNVLAVCTGGTALSMGLYDDTSSYTELLPSLKGFVTGSESEEDITLKKVLLSIKGSV